MGIAFTPLLGHSFQRSPAALSGLPRRKNQLLRSDPRTTDGDAVYQYALCSARFIGGRKFCFCRRFIRCLGYSLHLWREWHSGLLRGMGWNRRRLPVGRGQWKNLFPYRSSFPAWSRLAQSWPQHGQTDR